jgi:hypothetical protein
MTQTSFDLVHRSSPPQESTYFLLKTLPPPLGSRSSCYENKRKHNQDSFILYLGDIEEIFF